MSAKIVKAAQMNVKDIANITGLNVKVIRLLERRGLVSDTITMEQLDFMHLLSQIWKSEEFIKIQIANLSFERRVRILFTAGHTKPETYIIDKLLWHYSDREDEKFNLNLENLVDETMCHFQIPKKHKAKFMSTARRLRKKICDMRYRHMELAEISKALKQIRIPKSEAKKTSITKRTPQDQKAQNEIFGFN